MKPFIFSFKKSSPIIISCEHAGTIIPKQFKRLGLSSTDLARAKEHDAGSLEVGRLLARALGASLIHTPISRLVVDYNRRLDSSTRTLDTYHAPPVKHNAVVGDNKSDKLVPIPGNAISEKQIAKRYHTYVTPYFKTVELAVKKLKKQHGSVLIISLHSFHPMYRGDKRVVDIDVLFSLSEFLGKKLLKELKRSRYKVAPNKPWAMSDADDGVFKHLQSSTVQLLGIDIKNSIIRSASAQQSLAQLLAKSIKASYSLKTNK